MSPHDRERVRENLRRWHRVTRPTLPRCGAKARTTGEPCKHLALPNGRCRYHGGRSPTGDNWHRPVWPKGAVNAVEKLERKLRDRERAAKRRAARLARMSPEEREQHEAWQGAHRPGSAAGRRRRREDRRATAEARAMFREAASAPPPADPAISDLQRSIDELEKRLRGIAEDSASAPFDIFS